MGTFTKTLKHATLVLLLVLAIFHNGRAQQIPSAAASPPRLRLEPGKTYCFEYGYLWKTPWYWKNQDLTYPGGQRIWYRIRVTDKEQDTLYRCTLTIHRLFEYEQSPRGYEVFDSKYPTLSNTGDSRLLLEGFSYTGSINSRGRFMPDTKSLRLIDSLTDEMAGIYSGEAFSCTDSCFREKIKDILFRNLGILQLFYPEKNTSQWRPPVFAFEARSGTGSLAGVHDAYRGIKELKFIPRQGDYSLISFSYDPSKMRSSVGPGTDTVFIHNRSGFVSGSMAASVTMGWEGSVALSFYSVSDRPAVVQLEFAEGLSLGRHSRYLLSRQGIYEAPARDREVLRIPVDQPSLIELPDLGATLFVEPGDSLSVKVSADTNLQFGGRHARENKLLNRFRAMYEGWEQVLYGQWDSEAAEDRQPETYARELKQALAAQRGVLDSMKYELGPELFTLLYERTPYFQACVFANFLWPYQIRMASRKEDDNDKLLPEADEFFLPFIKDIPLYNADLMYSGYGYGTVYNRFLNHYEAFLRNYSDNDRDIAPPGGGVGSYDVYQLNFIGSHFGGYPYHFLVAGALENIAATMEGREQHFAPLFEEFLVACEDSVLKKQVAIPYNFKLSLREGKRFPEAEFAGKENKPVSIRDLKGHKVLLYLITEVELGNGTGKTPPSLSIIDSLSSLKERFGDVELVFLYIGTEQQDQWKRIAGQAPAGVHLWHVPPENTATRDFIRKLRMRKGLYQKTYFLIDERQQIFKTGVTNSARKKEGKEQHAGRIKAFFDRELQFFSLQRASLLDPHLKRWGLLALVVLVPVGLISYLIGRWRISVIRRKEEEKRRVTEIELRAIRAQLNPHFIFNTMSSIQHLVSSGENGKATGYLSDLAVLMRMVLKHTERGMISLAEEVEAVKKYLILEQLRFSFGYQVILDPRIDLHNTLVPAMLLQPYAENAVLHGISGKGGDGFLRILAAQSGGRIIYAVEDNGPGISRGKNSLNGSNPKGNKMSLKLMQEKLRLVYGEDMHLEILDLGDQDEGNTGTRVEISLPAFI